MSSSDNNSNIFRKDVSDVFDQLRKRAEDISTSEGSNRILQNLSNPTNLTNPQIISMRRNYNNSYYYKSIENSKVNRFIKVKSRNLTKFYRNNKDNKDINNSDLKEKALLNEQIKKILLRKEHNAIFSKSYKYSQSKKHINNNINSISNNSINNKKNYRKFKKNKTMNIIGEEEKDIWEKLKGINKNKFEKDIRVNQRKYVTTRDYINTTKNIQLMKYIRKNKIEKLNMLNTIKKSEINTLNKTLESLENNKEAILSSYQKKYVTYISYLNRQKDNEEKNNINLMITSQKIKNEISGLQSKINKMNKEKMQKLNLILLFIQYRERLKTLPDNAKELFGNYNNKIINNNNILNLNGDNNDINKILKYKNKIIYKDSFEFDYDYNEMEYKIRKRIEYKDKLKNDIIELKTNYLQIKHDIENNPNIKRAQYLMNNLDDLKYINDELKSELSSLKIKLDLEIINPDIYKSRNNNIYNTKKSLSRRSSLNSIINRTNQTNTTLNYFFNQENQTIYSPKSVLSFKKQFTIEKFDIKKASKLFNIIYNIYFLVKDNLFPEKKLKFDFNIKRGLSLEPEKSTILKMLEYIDIVVTLLLKQKEEYLSSNKLRKKYEKVKDLIDKEKRRMQFINNFKKDEEIRKLKLEQIGKKKNKGNYISSHKVENKYFFRTQKEQIAKAKNLAEFKKTPTFEDFMYDTMI